MKMSLLKIFLYSCLSLFILLSVSGCGKRGDLAPPVGELNEYPADYPKEE